MYEALGNAVDSEDEEGLDQVMAMNNMSRGGGGGGGGGAMFMSANNASYSMGAQRSMAPSAKSASKRKSKATSSVGGKKVLNDEVSTKLYKLSKK